MRSSCREMGTETFVPTYRDAFQFNPYYYPLWQHDLNGDGLAVYGAAGQRYRRGDRLSRRSGASFSNGAGSDRGEWRRFAAPICLAQRDLVLRPQRVSGARTVPDVILSSPLTIPAWGASEAKFCFNLDSNYDPLTRVSAYGHARTGQRAKLCTARQLPCRASRSRFPDRPDSTGLPG